jgi:hypothetical protein
MWAWVVDAVIDRGKTQFAAQCAAQDPAAWAIELLLLWRF